MVIRRVEPSHEDVAHLLARLAEHNRASYGDDGLNEAPPEEWLSALVAYEHARPVGMIGLRSLNGSAHLLRLYVEPDARGRGLTMRLARAALEKAAAAGFARAVWDTGVETTATLAVSELLGARSVAPFGEHEDAAGTRCFELDLRSLSAARQEVKSA